SVVAAQVNPNNDPVQRDRWIDDHSFNTDTFDELFSLPDPTHHYYAITIGDLRLVVLEATNIWRSPSLEPKTRGRYRERDEDLDDPSQWGYGQHLFEAIAQGSPQYTWLQAELTSPAFRQARYKVVMFHHPPHSLGDNVVPAYTDPVQSIDIAANGQIQSVRYEYPRDDDYLIRDVMPLLESAGVQLVFYGHSHLWNRFDSPSGMHFLESSNVGNTYGAFPDSTGPHKRRPIPIGFDQDYAATGDPNGLTPVIPTVAPLSADGQPQPYIASDRLTVFSILDTANGTVSSYYFDTATPTAPAVLFDQFTL
ncbi:MAG TPA: metallophosphoesterase, partial [Chroococcidiopsis sp.]